MGKHSKAIICGVWNADNLLALGSEDKTISISNIEGDTLKTISLHGEPSLMAFSEMKVNERSHGENTVRFNFSDLQKSAFSGIIFVRKIRNLPRRSSRV